MQTLNDCRALVTGASSGIGAATARALTAAGARVTLCARREELLLALQAELPGSEMFTLDVRDSARVAREIGSRPAFDIVIDNAGLSIGTEPLQEGSPADWELAIDTNIKGFLNVARAALPAMLERGRGDFVCLGSVAGRQVYPGGGVYCATKFAVRALYEAMRIDMAGKGLRFTSVNPGMVETEFSKVRLRGDREAAERIYAGMTPLTPEDVADAILYAVTRPPHVNVGEIVLWPTDQASTTLVRRDSR